MDAIRVKRQADAQGAVCRDCGVIFNITTCPYWHWGKSKYMHEQGSGHQLDYYTIQAPAWVRRAQQGQLVSKDFSYVQ